MSHMIILVTLIKSSEVLRRSIKNKLFGLVYTFMQQMREENLDFCSVLLKLKYYIEQKLMKVGKDFKEN